MSVLLLSLLLAGPMAGETKSAHPAPIVQSGTRNIPVGDPLRRPLLDTLRAPIEAELNQPVQFVVDTLRVQGDWAFFSGKVQRPDGRPIDFTRTSYAEELAEGMFDGPGTFGLMRRQGGRWTEVVHIIGPTDVAYMGWHDEYGAPESLFE
ncbi:hypothetical protein [Brevundimonas sp. NIBR11]|uniref:hypothetical protein n=1 Tax=Brevundimonas sp. NIBR11 TaxID=3015999 RepID=UPI0022F00D66|nr:hypothetical protein [Brevundimonas sp. NIBR11]WGM30806.1 hypothetical protein KKHFBJBL_01038 [Brevundimonas sp. NIBR11]